MIKQIQLRGISHSPSDKGTHDGGLEDCIDLRLIEQEQAPATAPGKVTDELATGLKASGIDVMYIHKTNFYTNYIGVKEVSTHRYLYAYIGSTPQQIVQLPGDYYPKSITSIGNMIIATTNDGALYILYKNGAYEYLGDKIPEPKVSVYASPHLSAVKKTGSLAFSMRYPSLCSGHKNDTPIDFWTYVRDRLGQNATENDAQANQFYHDAVETLWGAITQKKKDEIQNDLFLFPTLARYAVKLVDGSYIYQSSLIMLSGGTSNTDITVNANMIKPAGQDDGTRSWWLSTTFHNPYTATVAIEADATLAKWKDIIDSLDVFLSTDIMNPAFNANLGNAFDTGSGSAATTTGDDIEYYFEGADADPRKGFEEEIRKKGNFYLVESIPWDMVSGASRGLSPMMQDDLVVRKRLPESFPHDVCALGAMRSYNNRLLLCGDRVTLSAGLQAPMAWEVAAPPSGGYDYGAIVFCLRLGNGFEKRVYSFKDFLTGGESAVRAFVSYPDARCYMAYYYHKTGGGNYYRFTLPMKEHPLLNCAYGFWGLDSILGAENQYTGDDRTSDGDVHSYDIQEDRIITEDNVLRMSEMDSPFAFSLGNQVEYSSRIFDAVPITTALSTGQFGQFSIYSFTEEGIWAVSINDEGEIVTSPHPVSRDVANEGTIAQLDQAIVFISDQGVMMLSGSQIVCLSPNMRGHQFTLNDITPTATKNALLAALAADTDGWGDLVTIHLDTTDFIDFVYGCRPLYDYGGKRVLFFNPLNDYAYEYNLATQTWTKASVPGTFVRSLNSYPTAMAVFNDADAGNDIYNWSVLPEYNASPTPTARPGLIVTRPFDLGEPDIRKTIKSIRIRGQYEYKSVKYILLGSMNGVQWTKLLSLRGGSYKSFRLVILTDLVPDERITWIDIDYESRFGNKLR